MLAHPHAGSLPVQISDMLDGLREICMDKVCYAR